MHMLLKDQGYYWPGMRREIQEIINQCHKCKMSKISRLHNCQPLVLTDTPEQPFEKIAFDFIGPLQVTPKGNRHILILQDLFSKYVILSNTAHRDSECIINLLRHFLAYYEIPRCILTDNGSGLSGIITKILLEQYGIKHVKCTTYHPESNGSVERAIATVKDNLRL